jgi:hypothetical protein
MLRYLRTVKSLRLWVPEHLRLCVGQVLNVDRNRSLGFSDDVHLSEAVAWLQRAQDATGDGGVSGRFQLSRGWTSSYPETTGYIIPTWLKLSEIREDNHFIDRAEKCVRFLLSTQLKSGAFPAGEIAENRTEPSPFNSAQIIHGLIAWHRFSGEQRVLDSAKQAADWLIRVQDPDGAFRKHSYRGVPASYAAHASCWLAELGSYTGEERYQRAATRHLDWVLRHFIDERAWFDLCGFDVDEHTESLATAHTIAYTIFGVLYMSQLLGREDGIQAAKRAACAALRCAELQGGVPGVMNSKWRPAANYACLTGNAQLALIWFRLFEIEGDLRYVNAALNAIDEVKRAQAMHLKHPGLRGGIPGSAPIWGDYMHCALPNWAAKFYIDALVMKKEVMNSLDASDKSALTSDADSEFTSHLTNSAQHAAAQHFQIHDELRAKLNLPLRIA